jgi:long-chain acyl-CoA synthetase
MLTRETLGELFLNRVKESGTHNAIGWIDNDTIKFLTYQDYFRTVASIYLSLKSLGFVINDKVAILSKTRKEWHLLDMAIMTTGGCTVPIYPTYLSQDIEHIINHSDSNILIIENNEQFVKLYDFSKFQNVKLIISLDELPEESIKRIRNWVHYINYKDLLLMGSDLLKSHPDGYENAITLVSKKHLASIIYTSGTTGDPKGAMVEHLAFCKMIENVKSFVKDTFSFKDRTLTFLPLSHIFGRVDSLMPLAFGWECVYSSSYDLLIEEIKIVKPTVMLAVPRIFEKIYEKIENEIKASHTARKKIFYWAQKAADRYFNKIDRDLTPTTTEFTKYKIAYEFILKDLYNMFGGKIRYFISGGAPLNTNVIKMLRNANLTLLEGYGLTETIAPCTLNPFSRQIIGTVGRPIGDVEIKFLDDNEILIKTQAMFSGYYKDEDATKEAFIDQNWFATGDIGEFDSSGHLKITDRKKDIIITSNGKNIAPQKIEAYIKTSQHILDCVVYGEQKKFLTAILIISAELVSDAKFNEIIKLELSAMNEKLAPFEQIKNYILLGDKEVSEKYTTPSLKIKKKSLLQDYQTQLNNLYLTKNFDI